MIIPTVLFWPKTSHPPIPLVAPYGQQLCTPVALLRTVVGNALVHGPGDMVLTQPAERRVVGPGMTAEEPAARTMPGPQYCALTFGGREELFVPKHPELVWSGTEPVEYVRWSNCDKADLHKYVDMFKGNKDMLTIDAAEAEPHIKLVVKPDAEASVLKKRPGSNRWPNRCRWRRAINRRRNRCR